MNDNDGDDTTARFLQALEDGTACWEDYWKWRKWDFSAVSSAEERVLAKALTTRALTTPLTAFSALWRTTLRNSAATLKEKDVVQDANDSISKELCEQQRTHNFRWCCLGARSEASLPTEYWNELLCLITAKAYIQDSSTSTMQSAVPEARSVYLSIDFCGPEMDARRPDVRLSSNTMNSNTSLTLRWVYQGKFHDYYHHESDAPAPEYDAYLLFNPGVGHPHLREEWRPTLELLVNKTLLVTAHSDYDASRDAAVLSQCYQNAVVEYVENPFACLVEFEDPFLDGHVVRPNQRVAVVSSAGTS